MSAPFQEHATNKPKLPDNSFVWLDEFCQQPPSTSWLVRDYLELDSLAAIFGDSEAGKSFLSIDIACHVAHGIPWCGNKTKQGIVLYIAGEGQNGLKRRFKAWHEREGLPVKKNIAVRTVPAALCEPEKAEALAAYIKNLVASIGEPVVLIVVDTLNRNFGNGNENDTKDMTAFVAGMDCIRTATGACLLVVHHCGHGDKTRMRAAISLHNAVDNEYLVAREGDRQNITSLKTTMTNTKTKEGLTPKPLSWNWETQSLPWCELDDEGFPVPLFSAVLVPTEYVKPVKKSALPVKQKQALNILKDLYSAFRQNLIDAEHDPDGARVSIKDWYKAMTEIEEDSGNKKHIRDALEKRNLIMVFDSYVKPL